MHMPGPLVTCHQQGLVFFLVPFHLAALGARMKLAKVAPDEATYLALVEAFKAGGLSRGLA